MQAGLEAGSVVARAPGGNGKVDEAALDMMSVTRREETLKDLYQSDLTKLDSYLKVMAAVAGPGRGQFSFRVEDEGVQIWAGVDSTEAGQWLQMSTRLPWGELGASCSSLGKFSDWLLGAVANSLVELSSAASALNNNGMSSAVVPPVIRARSEEAAQQLREDLGRLLTSKVARFFAEQEKTIPLEGTNEPTAVVAALFGEEGMQYLGEGPGQPELRFRRPDRRGIFGVRAGHALLKNGKGETITRPFFEVKVPPQWLQDARETLAVIAEVTGTREEELSPAFREKIESLFPRPTDKSAPLV